MSTVRGQGQHVISVTVEGKLTHVLFEADLTGMDSGHHEWGYYLERGDEGLWHIVDAGVA